MIEPIGIDLSYRGSSRLRLEVDISCWGLGILFDLEHLIVNFAVGPFHVYVFFD